jgi:hypothetical protein
MWKLPSQTKMYEALGAVADGRIEVSGNAGKCYSSSGNKFYNITFDPNSNAIMSNDNTSYWTGELGYPAVAYLLSIGVLEYKPDLGELLKGIAWKDINQKYKNDFKAALVYILKDLTMKNRKELHEYTSSLVESIKNLDLQQLGEQVVPPEGY